METSVWVVSVTVTYIQFQASNFSRAMGGSWRGWDVVVLFWLKSRIKSIPFRLDRSSAFYSTIVRHKAQLFRVNSAKELTL